SLQRSLQNETNNIGEATPVLGFGLEMCAPVGSELVELGFPAGFGLFPCGLEQLFIFETVKSRIERSLLNLQSLAGHLLNSLCNRISVNGAKRNNPHDEQIEGSLREIKFIY